VTDRTEVAHRLPISNTVRTEAVGAVEDVTTGLEVSVEAHQAGVYLGRRGRGSLAGRLMIGKVDLLAKGVRRDEIYELLLLQFLHPPRPFLFSGVSPVVSLFLWHLIKYYTNLNHHH
jgi:hypothetical protein